MPKFEAATILKAIQFQKLYYEEKNEELMKKMKELARSRIGDEGSSGMSNLLDSGDDEGYSICENREEID